MNRLSKIFNVSALALFSLFTTENLMAQGKGWQFVQEAPTKITIDVVSSDETPGLYDVTYLTSSVNPKTQELETVRTKLGFGIPCSEYLFGDGSDPARLILSCENKLADDTFLLVNIGSLNGQVSHLEAEVELYSSKLGSVIYKSIGSDFSRTAL